jgi:hypothetical protein
MNIFLSLKKHNKTLRLLEVLYYCLANLYDQRRGF